MPRIALATSEKYSQLTEDDRLLVSPLANVGYAGEPVVWTDPTVAWRDYDGVVIRSCWDYHLKSEQFLDWISSVSEAGIPILNSPEVIRWNVDKIYLRDLEEKGIEIVPTLWPERDQKKRFLQEIMADASWSKAVVKPRISATAHKTQLVSIEEADSAQPLFESLRNCLGVVLLNFMEPIVSAGEWSLMFFGGEFSHAVLKKAKPGDFRVQNDFGGTSAGAEPPQFILDAAQKVLRTVDKTAYARVDGVVEDGRFLLVELEFIEPALFLGSHRDAAKRFASSIHHQLSAERSAVR